MGRLQDITGNRYGRLTVTEHLGVRGRRAHYWKCKCDCGKIVESSGDNLKKGSCKSCGCITKESSWTRTHNLSKEPEYVIWNAIKRRCKSEKNYADRGIKVCDRWINSFENFYKDMGKKPEGMSIDRIDVNGDYCPENCRWATTHQQNRNRRNNVYIEYKGQKKILTDWARELNISVQTLHLRLNKYNYTIEEAFNKK